MNREEAASVGFIDEIVCDRKVITEPEETSSPCIRSLTIMHLWALRSASPTPPSVHSLSRSFFPSFSVIHTHSLSLSSSYLGRHAHPIVLIDWRDLWLNKE